MFSDNADLGQLLFSYEALPHCWKLIISFPVLGNQKLFSVSAWVASWISRRMGWALLPSFQSQMYKQLNISQPALWNSGLMFPFQEETEC